MDVNILFLHLICNYRRIIRIINESNFVPRGQSKEGGCENFVSQSLSFDLKPDDIIGQIMVGLKVELFTQAVTVIFNTPDRDSQ
jgi:hypothetical protein